MNRSERRAHASDHPFGWTPWEPGRAKPISEEAVQEIARRSGRPIDEVRKLTDSVMLETIWLNNVYQVAQRIVPVTSLSPIEGLPHMIHLSVKRRDRRAVGVERFPHFQRIKSDLVGAEHEGVEVYPAESRLVDGAHQYHIWCSPHPGWRFPFGFDGGRCVTAPISESDGEFNGT